MWYRHFQPLHKTVTRGIKGGGSSERESGDKVKILNCPCTWGCISMVWEKGCL